MTNTKDNELLADGDPRLTAYALGELEGAERAQVEALLARDPAARAEVEAIRATAEELGAEFAAEAAGPAPSLTEAQKSAIANAARGAGAPVRRNPLRWMAPLAAAAALLVWVVVANREELSGTPREAVSEPIAMNEPAARELTTKDKFGLPGAVDHKQIPSPSSESGQGGAAASPSVATTPSDGSSADLVALGDEQQATADAAAAQPAANAPASVARQLGPDEKSVQDKLSALGYAGAGGRSDYRVMHESESDALAVAPQFSMRRAAESRQPASAAAAPAAQSAPPTNPAAAKASTVQDNLFAKADDHEHEELAFRYFKSAPPAPGTESYQPIVEQDFQSPWTVPLSTFGVDVDTASYSNVRRFLNNGQLPPADAVRLEELVNYFHYDDPGPAADAPDGCPFGVNVQIAQAPWAPTHRLVRIGLKGREVPAAARPSSNLVFLLDVSGSMDEPDKLPLLQQCLKLLTRSLDARDRVAIVVYAGAAGRVLDSTVCDAAGRDKIIDALDRLHAGGNTAGAAGIELAYDTATQTFLKEGTNRVILCTDGDFNVGVTDRDSLQHLIEGRAKSGVFLTVLGFGEGNLKDGTAELLADKGNGVYAYIDSLDEGRRVLVQQMGGTLQTIAKDVKLQVEFNPAQVGAYRLLGYEDRALAAQDFNDDRKDAGDIGAGHGVTALYEIVPASLGGLPGVDQLKYQSPPAAPKPELVASDELLNVKLRWKEPSGDASRKIEVPVRDAGGTLAQAPADLRFAAAVAGFGMKLRGSEHAKDLSWALIAALADSARGSDPDGWRAEFVRLAKIAAGLQGEPVPAELTPEMKALLEKMGYIGGDRSPRR